MTHENFLELINKAKDFSKEQHKGQKNTKSGEDYIEHPRRIYNHFLAIYESYALRFRPPSEKNEYRDVMGPILAVSALHDVVEDCGVELDSIRDMFGDKVADGVDAITRRQGESYMNFIRRCGENHIARKVKLADLEDNLDIMRIVRNESYKFKDNDFSRIKKYIKAWRYLQEVEKSCGPINISDTVKI